MTTPAEDRAARDNLPIVAVTPFELLRAAGGHPMIVGTLNGGEVLLRLPRPDEFMAAHLAAIAKMPENARPEPMDMASVQRLVAPLPL